VVAVLSASTELVLRVLGIRASDEPAVTEEEIKLLIEQGAQAGVLAAAEEEILTRVFRLADRRVGEVMTPRPQVVWLDSEDPPPVLFRHMASSRHTQFPLAEGDLDHVLGVVSLTDLWSRTVDADGALGTPPDPRTVMRPPLFVPESMAALAALERFTQTGARLALVVDEFGGTQGLITLYDLMEAIISDAPALDERGEPLIVQRADGSWLLDGLLSTDELTERLDLHRPLPDPHAYQTLGGFVLHQLGHIPSTGDHFEFDDLRFEVIDMDGRRIDRVLVTPRPDMADAPTGADLPYEQDH
jgi:putative hemolysin